MMGKSIFWGVVGGVVMGLLAGILVTGWPQLVIGAIAGILMFFSAKKNNGKPPRWFCRTSGNKKENNTAEKEK